MSEDRPVILITGANGTIGSGIIDELIRRGHPTSHIIGLSNDEDGLWALNRRTGVYVYYCDIRDPEALADVFRNIERHTPGEDWDMGSPPIWVVHCAALKHIDVCEWNPVEATRTNAGGTLNVLRACEKSERAMAFLLVSTDKVVDPTTHMGKTKAIAETYTLEAHRRDRLMTAVVRFGNVIGSRGSILHVLRDCAIKGVSVPVTADSCSRYSITPQGASGFTIDRLWDFKPGRTYVPILPRYKLRDLIDAFGVVWGNPLPIITTGLRPGEKLDEIMIADHELARATDLGNYIEIPPICDKPPPTDPPLRYPDTYLTPPQLQDLIQGWLDE